MNGSTGTALLSKPSSSEWSSSDDFTNCVSEQGDSLSYTDVPLLAQYHASQNLSHTSGPPLPPKPQSLRPENRRGVIQDSFHIRPKSLAYKGTALSKLSSEIWLENSEPNLLSSSDSSSKSGSSDHERNDLSASESEGPSIPHYYVESAVTREHAIPTPYFSVDTCMTDTYRAKYHKKRSTLHTAADSKTGEHRSSSESDHRERAAPASADVKILDLTRTRKETGTITMQDKFFNNLITSCNRQKCVNV